MHALRVVHVRQRAGGLFPAALRKSNAVREAKAHLGSWRMLDLSAAAEKGPPMTNPRYANGALRRKHRARLKAMGAPCGICGGRLGPIHYDEPSDAAHPLSFVVDEIRPVARWREFGYASPRAAAEDWNNLQAAHYWCNAQKGCKLSPAKPNSAQRTRTQKPPADGSW